MLTVDFDRLGLRPGDRVRQPFNTNALGQVAALESLRHPEELHRRVLASPWLDVTLRPGRGGLRRPARR